MIIYMYICIYIYIFMNIHIYIYISHLLIIYELYDMARNAV